jgi:putative membrane protein
MTTVRALPLASSAPWLMPLAQILIAIFSASYLHRLVAHEATGSREPPGLATAWSLEPLLIAALLLLVVVYGLGLRKLWRNGVGRGVSVLQAAGFAVGWLTLVVAMVWPLDVLGAWSLAAHTAQHMLLMAVAPPLLLMGQALAVVLGACPARWARILARPRRWPASRWKPVGPATLLLTCCLNAAVMWSWHVPAAMEAALRHDSVHYAMHASYLLAGLLFWAALIRAARGAGPGILGAVLAIIATMIPMGLLGALMTFAEEPRFPYYIGRAPLLGLTALEDQQLAGLIMWVPAAVPYVLGGVALAAMWFDRIGRSVRSSPGE